MEERTVRPSEINGTAVARWLGYGDYGFNDFRLGDAFQTGAVLLTEGHVLAFAGVSGDLYDLHMDPQYARDRGFDDRIAHGLLGLAMADGLKTRCGIRMNAVAALSWEWQFDRPLKIGDRVCVVAVVAELRRARSGDRGIMGLQMQLLNDRNEIVQHGLSRLLLYARSISETNRSD